MAARWMTSSRQPTRQRRSVYLRTFTECFPGCGVLGEEDSYSLAPTPPLTAYFTVDPIDGTRAFIRRQSHGITTMVALVDGGQVISAYVGDVSSDEVYGYRPGSEKVHRITRLDTFETLNPHLTALASAKDMVLLLRDPLDKYSAQSAALVPRFQDLRGDGVVHRRVGRASVEGRDFRDAAAAVVRDAMGFNADHRNRPQARLCLVAA